MLVIGAVVILGSLRPLWRFRNFGRVSFDVTSQPGRYRIEFRPRRTVPLQRVFIRMCCFEQIPGRRRSLLPKRFRKLPPAGDRMVEVEIDALVEPREIQKEEEVCFEGAFELPEDAPFTLHRFSSPSVIWQAELRVKHDDSETLLGSHSLEVQTSRRLEHKQRMVSQTADSEALHGHQIEPIGKLGK